MKTYNSFIASVIGLATYNVFYGALCYYLVGFQGVLLGANFMLFAGIIGIIITKYKHLLSKEKDLICPIDNLKCPVAELGKEKNLK